MAICLAISGIFDGKGKLNIWAAMVYFQTMKNVCAVSRKRRHSESGSEESDEDKDPALNRALHTRKRLVLFL